jgi:hypothetical protein
MAKECRQVQWRPAVVRPLPRQARILAKVSADFVAETEGASFEEARADSAVEKQPYHCRAVPIDRDQKWRVAAPFVPSAGQLGVPVEETLELPSVIGADDGNQVGDANGHLLSMLSPNNGDRGCPRLSPL